MREFWHQLPIRWRPRSEALALCMMKTMLSRNLANNRNGMKTFSYHLSYPMSPVTEGSDSPKPFRILALETKLAFILTFLVWSFPIIFELLKKSSNRVDFWHFIFSRILQKKKIVKWKRNSNCPKNSGNRSDVLILMFHAIFPDFFKTLLFGKPKPKNQKKWFRWITNQKGLSTTSTSTTHCWIPPTWKWRIGSR